MADVQAVTELFQKLTTGATAEERAGPAAEVAAIVKKNGAAALASAGAFVFCYQQWCRGMCMFLQSEQGFRSAAQIVCEPVNMLSCTLMKVTWKAVMGVYVGNVHVWNSSRV
jgi:hypothetical protein